MSTIPICGNCGNPMDNHGEPDESCPPRILRGDMKQNLYLIEFYTKDGAIKFAWVSAFNRWEAVGKLAMRRHCKFAEAITVEEQSHKVQLLLSPGNKAIDLAADFEMEAV